MFIIACCARIKPEEVILQQFAYLYYAFVITITSVGELATQDDKLFLLSAINCKWLSDHISTHIIFQVAENLNKRGNSVDNNLTNPFTTLMHNGNTLIKWHRL